MLTFLLKNGKMKLSGGLYFENARKQFKSNLVLVVVLVLESKGLYYDYPRLETLIFSDKIFVEIPRCLEIPLIDFCETSHNRKQATKV